MEEAPTAGIKDKRVSAATTPISMNAEAHQLFSSINGMDRLGGGGF